MPIWITLKFSRKFLKNKIDEHSTLLEQSVKKLSQLEPENMVLREENSAVNTMSNKRRRFQTRVQPV